MAERRVAEVMRQGDRLREILIQGERAGDRATDRGDFDGVRESRQQMIAGTIQKDLRLVLQSPKRARMNHARPVALVVSPMRMRGLGVLPTTGFSRLLRVNRERRAFEFFLL